MSRCGLGQHFTDDDGRAGREGPGRLGRGGPDAEGQADDAEELADQDESTPKEAPVAG